MGDLSNDNEPSELNENFKLNEILEYLEKNQPDIKASVEFKKKLKNRLYNIIALK
jgi:hypothetical protein